MRKSPVYFIRTLERLTGTYGWLATGEGIYIECDEDEARKLSKILTVEQVRFDVAFENGLTQFVVPYQ